MSVLSAISKIFGKILQTQIMEYIDNKLSVFVSAYRKGYSTQHVLLLNDGTSKPVCAVNAFCICLVVTFSPYYYYDRYLYEYIEQYRHHQDLKCH